MLHMVSLTDNATNRYVWLILLHMDQFDWYCYILASMTVIATYRSVWQILVSLIHNATFQTIAVFIICGSVKYKVLGISYIDWYSYIHVSLTDIATYGSVWLILLHKSKYDRYCYIQVILTDIATYGSV